MQVVIIDLYLSAGCRTISYPVALHLDHHEDIPDICHKVISGVRSAMIDASHFHFEENIRIVKEVVNSAIIGIVLWKLN